MPSKLKKAIGAVKDQTSIGLAKVGSNNESANLEVAVLKVTSHDEAPMDERYVAEILQLIASNKVYAAACAQAISRRLKKTRTWTVALKSLMLVLRVFQDGDPYFPREVLHTMKRGGRILNLSTFRDHSKSSNPWDYTAYVRTFALYLEERLDCFLMGKLQRRVAFRTRESRELRRRRSTEPIIREMKPAMLLDRILYWQRLLERAIATRPTGAAKANRLVQFSLHAAVQESFDLYRDISDGLALLLDSFFHLQYQSCVNAFQTCVKASKQFEDLSEYYDLCKGMGVGRISEYPSVHKISEELIETLREFLKDQSSFPNNGRPPPSPNLLLAPDDSSLRSERFLSDRTERLSGSGSEHGSQCTSLEDLFSVTDGSTSTSSPSPSLTPSPPVPTNEQEQSPGVEMFNRDRQTQLDDGDNNFSTRSSTLHGGANAATPAVDLVTFDEWPEAEPHREHGPQDPVPSSLEAPRECWELALAEIANQAQPNDPISGSLHSSLAPNNLFDDEQPAMPHCRNSNPFLDDDTTGLTGLELIPFPSAAATTTSQESFFPSEDIFSVAPTFQAMAIAPTFNAQSPNQSRGSIEDDADPFSSNFNPRAIEQRTSVFGASTDQQNLQQEQQLWLQHQNKIISKRMAW